MPLFSYTFVCLYVCFPHSSVCLIVDHAPVTFGHLTHLEFCAVRDTDAQANRTITCSIILTASVVFSHRLVSHSFCASFASHVFVVMIMSQLTCSIILTASVVFSHRLDSHLDCARASPSVPVTPRSESASHSSPHLALASASAI